MIFKICKDIEHLMMDIIMTSDLTPVGQLKNMNKLSNQSEDELCLYSLE